MVDFGVFDSLLDSVFAVDGTGKVVYCNQTAATLCETPPRRIINKMSINELIDFAELKLPLVEGSPGFDSPSPYFESPFKLVKAEKTGKVQITIYPMEKGKDRIWFLFTHDVTLEETLHGKYRLELEQKEGYIAELEKARQQLENYSK